MLTQNPKPKPAAGAAYGAFTERYELKKTDRLGHGANSKVYKCRRHGIAGAASVVAVKVVAQRQHADKSESVHLRREYAAVRVLRHRNVVRFVERIDDAQQRQALLVFEYVPHTLYDLVPVPGKNRPQLAPEQLRCLATQLFRALQYIHHARIMHRDLKCENILISADGVLKLADFGLARQLDQHVSSRLTFRVVTLYYRAPELLLGATTYSTAVDMWSAACVLFELAHGLPLFGQINERCDEPPTQLWQSEVQLLHAIFSLCGTPQHRDWPGRDQLVFWPQFAQMRPQPRTLVPVLQQRLRAHTNQLFVQLLDSLLQFDPLNRKSAEQCLRAQWLWAPTPACMHETHITHEPLRFPTRR